MMKGVRRGCVRLRSAIIGIDDQDVNTFTITVDHKTFHFQVSSVNLHKREMLIEHTQARDGDEREKWVRHLEDTIARNTHRYRAFGDTASTSGSSSSKNNYLTLFDRKVTEADTYLQMIIDQATKIEQQIETIEDAEEKEKYEELKDQTNAMLDNIKHSIVLLQIAKVINSNQNEKNEKLIYDFRTQRIQLTASIWVP